MTPGLWWALVFGIVIGVTCSAYRNHNGVVSHAEVYYLRDAEGINW